MNSLVWYDSHDHNNFFEGQNLVLTKWLSYLKLNYIYNFRIIEENEKGRNLPLHTNSFYIHHGRHLNVRKWSFLLSLLFFHLSLGSVHICQPGWELTAKSGSSCFSSGNPFALWVYTLVDILQQNVWYGEWSPRTEF